MSELLLQTTDLLEDLEPQPLPNYTIIKLLPGQISEVLGVLRVGLFMGLSRGRNLPVLEQEVANIIESIAMGDMTAWMVLKKVDAGWRYCMSVLTIFSDDYLKQERHLVIYSLASFEVIPPSVWKYGLETIA